MDVKLTNDGWTITVTAKDVVKMVPEIYRKSVEQDPFCLLDHIVEEMQGIEEIFGLYDDITEHVKISCQEYYGIADTNDINIGEV